MLRERCLALVFSLLTGFDVLGQSCNTRSGVISDQPDLPVLLSPREVSDLTEDRLPEVQIDLNISARFLDLENHIESLLDLRGPYTLNVPVLALRLENYPGFDPRKHCNKVAVRLVRPQITPLGGDRWRASWDNGRFALEFDRRTQANSYVVDSDPSQRLVWIFPTTFGRHRKTSLSWDLADHYDRAFRAAPKGSAQRRWIGEAYLNIALRTYRQAALNQGFPLKHAVKRNALSDAIRSRSPDIDCGKNRSHFVCLLHDLIELNEIGRADGGGFPDSAFRVSDALLVNSGIATGIRQLDFATKNEQAEAIADKLLPELFRSSPRGYGWRRPIRQWDVDNLTAWYQNKGRGANVRLSEEEAQEMLVHSHAQFLVDSARVLPVVMQTYRGWTLEMQTLLALISADLQNVSGYTMRLPASTDNYCAVLNDRTLDSSKRSNRGVVKAHRERVRNAEALVRQRLGASVDDCWTYPG